jgi:hypothetical protein
MAAANKFTTCQFILQSCPFASSALASSRYFSELSNASASNLLIPFQPASRTGVRASPTVSDPAPLTSPARPQTAVLNPTSHHAWPPSRRLKATPTPTTPVSKSSDTSSRAPKQTPISANSHTNSKQSVSAMTILEIITRMIGTVLRVRVLPLVRLRILLFIRSWRRIIRLL